MEKNSSENDKNMVVKEGKNETDVNKEQVTEEKEEEPKNEEHETNDDTAETSGCHTESMLGYVNDAEVIVDEVKVEGEGQMVEAMLFKGETELEKEERMAVIGQSIVISHLEDDLDEILKTKISVKYTEERILPFETGH